MQEKETAESLQLRIRALEKEVKQLHSQIKNQRYGLVWLDVPEAFDQESENKIPILEEVKDKAIHTPDGKPTHILIEGDNYHALTCLNYTHRGKIDVIYIDPPYNTGNDGFTYKDKRFLKEYPNGESITKDHPLRHSAWLSFMNKRLKLANELLSNDGIIFISIDNNEVAQLKLLCDQVFQEESFVEIFLWNKTSTPPALSYKSRKTHEYILCYQKRKNNRRFIGMTNEGGDAPLLNESNQESVLKFPPNYVKTKLADGIYPSGLYDRVKLLNDIEVKQGIIVSGFSLKGRFRWIQSTLDDEILKRTKLIIKSKKLAVRYCREGDRSVAPANLISEVIYEKDSIINKSLHCVDTNERAGKDLSEIFDGMKIFDFPKPVSLISYLLEFNDNKNSTILDFFAGSGTTLHATMQLNKKDGGNRQCILVQQQEEKRICETITYERNRRVMQGYINPKGEEIPGLGNSLKYYRTTFVGENPAQEASDTDKTLLAQKAGYLLALGENTLDEINRNEHYQLFSDGKRLTAVYFTEDARWLDDFVAELEQWHSEHKGAVCAYIFSWSDGEEYISMLEHLPRTEIKSIPQPILEIYKKLYS